jgi:predicted outer membrane protein
MFHPFHSWRPTIAALGLTMVFGPTGFAAEPVQNAVTRPVERLRQAGERIENAGRRLEQAGNRLENEARPVTANKVATPDRQAHNADFVIASAMAICNAEEVAIAKFAKENAKNDSVKQFAQTLVEDHQKALQQLEKFGARPQLGEAGSNAQPVRSDVTADRTARQPVATNPAAAAPGSTQQPRLTQQNQRGFDFLGVQREIAGKCIASAKKCWQDKKTPQAELAFVGSQIVLHQQSINSAEVLQQHASPELQSVIESQVKSLREHLNQAEQLMEQLIHEKQASTS